MRLIARAVILTVALTLASLAEAQRRPEVGVLVFGTESLNVNMPRGVERLREALRDFGPPRECRPTRLGRGACESIGGGGDTAGELASDEVGVEVAPGDELRVATDLHHPAVVEHNDRVRVAHRGEAVGDDERGPVARQPLERGADGGLAYRIEGRRRLVQDQHRRVLEKSPGGPPPPTLAPREVCAPPAPGP